MTKEKFSWTDENAAKAVELYTQEREANPDNANSTDFLRTIALEIGANSPQSVRSKLTSMKVYQKNDIAVNVGGSSSVRKIHLVRAIEKAGDLEKGSLESLEKAKQEDLRKLIDILEAQSILDEMIK